MISIEVGDVFDVVPAMRPASAHCIVTSPPYWGLRDYQTATWAGGDPTCDHRASTPTRTANSKASSTLEGGKGNTHRSLVHKRSTATERRDGHAHPFRGGEHYSDHKHEPTRGPDSCPRCGATRIDAQIGLEPTPEAYVERIVELWRHLKRVLRPDGVCWLNLGDTYATGAGTARRPGGGQRGSAWQGPTTQPNRMPISGLQPKDLTGIPWRVALALQADGWILRSALPWVKRSAMPESVRDRPVNALEYVFQLVQSRRYYYDEVAVRRASTWGGETKRPDGWASHEGAHGPIHREGREKGAAATVEGGSRAWRNGDLFFDSVASSSWGMISDAEGNPIALDVIPEAFPQAHFATFPTALVDPLIRTGTSDRGCCPACGAQYKRVIDKGTAFTSGSGRSGRDPSGKNGPNLQGGGATGDVRRGPLPLIETVGWAPTCECNAGEPIPCTVLDPFMGSGTTALVAALLGRDAVGVELSAEYSALARERIGLVSAVEIKEGGRRV